MAMHAAGPDTQAGTPRAHREAEAALAEVEAHPGRQADAALETKGHLDSLLPMLTSYGPTPMAQRLRTCRLNL